MKNKQTLWEEWSESVPKLWRDHRTALLLMPTMIMTAYAVRAIDDTFERHEEYLNTVAAYEETTLPVSERLSFDERCAIPQQRNWEVAYSVHQQLRQVLSQAYQQPVLGRGMKAEMIGQIERLDGLLDLFSDSVRTYGARSMEMETLDEQLHAHEHPVLKSVFSNAHMEVELCGELARPLVREYVVMAEDK